MKKNWITAESRKADETKDYALLENPNVKRSLDELLLTRFWPVILECLVDTDYNYSPQEGPTTEFVLGPELTRSLQFMLLDGRRAFFRGRLKCSRAHWMLESEFFLGLHGDNDRNVLFEILGNSRLTGNPPTLHVYKRDPDCFQITFQSGRGAGWGLYGEEEIDKRVKEIIKVNTEMYKSSVDGSITEEDFASFLTLAYRVYEAF